MKESTFNFGSNEIYRFQDSRQDKSLNNSSATHKVFQENIDCDLPEMEVCYKEIDHDAVKDIGVDKETFGVGTRTITHRMYEDGVELELFVSGELGPSMLDHPSKIDRELPIQEYGMRSFLRSFLHTLDGGNENPQQNPTNGDEQVADCASIDRWKYGEGEISFDAVSFITYSGSIPFSGSLSHRSDSSATSGKSFAFPVLRSEWNSSSPERMAKGDKRHLRKHRDWKSKFLCCKF